MKRVALLAVAVLLAGCGGGGSSGSQGILAGLGDDGVKATSPEPEPPGVLEVPSTAYHVPGGVLHIFTFTDERTAKEAQARIQPGGYMIQNTMGINQAVDWSAPPHWFRDGREIAVYLGTSPDVTGALAKVAGPQFAGA